MIMISPSWRKSSYSSGEASCVEVGHDAARIAVRDTKDQDGPALAFTPAGWQAFTRRVRDGAAGR
jgi:hypothetical protein